MPNQKDTGKVKKISQKQKKEAPKAAIQVDEKAVQILADILNDTHLSEIEYETEAGRIRVAKHAMPVGYPEMAVPNVAMPSPPAQSPASSPADSAPTMPTREGGVSHDQNNHPGVVKAPMVGTIYLSPQPDADPFVKTGDTVKEGDTLVIIEAMKVMNPIRAHKSGVVKEILVSNGEPVEFDHPLLIVE